MYQPSIEEVENLDVFEFRVFGYYVTEDFSWNHSINEIAKICKISVGKVSQVVRKLTSLGYTEPHPNQSEFRTSGYIYVITDGENRYKIGLASDCNARLQELQTGNALELKIVFSAYIQNALLDTEKRLHEIFADKHIRFEWFALTPDDVEYIKGLAE